MGNEVLTFWGMENERNGKCSLIFWGMGNEVLTFWGMGNELLTFWGMRNGECGLNLLGNGILGMK